MIGFLEHFHAVSHMQLHCMGVKEHNTGSQQLQWMPFRRRPPHLCSSTSRGSKSVFNHWEHSAQVSSVHRDAPQCQAPSCTAPTHQKTGQGICLHNSHRMLHHTCNPPMHATPQCTAITPLTIPIINSCFCKAGVGSQPPTPASIFHSRLDIFSTVVPGRIY